MRYLMIALCIGVLAGTATANGEGGYEGLPGTPLPQSFYDLRRPEETRARSLGDAMRTRRVQRQVTRTGLPVFAAAPLGSPIAARAFFVRRPAAPDRPAAIEATHVGSDAVPPRPAFSLERNAIAAAAPGTCARCGEKAGESYAIYCTACRASRSAASQP